MVKKHSTCAIKVSITKNCSISITACVILVCVVISSPTAMHNLICKIIFPITLQQYCFHLGRKVIQFYVFVKCLNCCCMYVDVLGDMMFETNSIDYQTIDIQYMGRNRNYWLPSISQNAHIL